MATEYKIIKIRRNIESNFIPSNLLPGELHITTDSGKVHYCYSAGNVKQLATIEQLQELLNISPEAYIALQQLISDLEDETVLTGILNDIVYLNDNKLDIDGDSKDNVVSFAEATTETDIVSGETHSTLFGKILKTIKTFRAKFTKVDTNIATTYSASSTYTVGTYCLYDGLLYKCNTAITVAETWTPSKWTQVNLGAENKALNDNLAKKFTTISGTLPDSTSGVGLQVPYPTGFTRTNTMVTAEHWSDTGGRLRDQFYSTNLGMTVALETEYITINARITEALNRPYRIALMRYDI